MAGKVKAQSQVKQTPSNLQNKIEEELASLPEGQLPEGYQSVKADRVKVWWNPSSGDVVMGIVKGRFMQRAKDGRPPSNYYQILLSRPTTGREKVDGEPQDVDVEKGQLINVKETYELQFLAPILERSQEEGFGVSVIIRPVGKENIGGGQTVWHYDIGWKKEDVPF